MAGSSQDIIVIGGGIIGCCTAYYITCHPSYNPALHKVRILEASRIAGGASGKAGGLLALWAYPANIVPLSYRLHAELAKEHNGAQRWGHRQIECGQLEARGRQTRREKANGHSVSLQKRDKSALDKLRSAGFPIDLDWIATECGTSYEAMADSGSTAQVHPYHFTKSIAKLARESGVEIIEGAHVDKISQASGEAGKPIRVEWTQDESKTESLASTVVLAAGPWTKHLLPSAPIGGLRAHSVTIRPSRPVSGFALFTEIQLGRNKTVTPEIYARPDQEVYACGEGDTLVPLPKTTADVVVDESRCQDVIDFVGSISDELRDGEVTARQACYLPVSRNGPHGGPFIGAVGSVPGLILAAGHSCWGIQNGPGTGKCVAELVMDGKVSSAKLGHLDAAQLGF